MTLSVKSSPILVFKYYFSECSWFLGLGCIFSC